VATYEVQFATSAAKEFRSLPPELKRRTGAAIDGLSQDPRPPGVRLWRNSAASWWGTDACIESAWGSTALYMRLTTRSNSFVSHAFDTGGKFTDKLWRRLTRHWRLRPNPPLVG
jgi:hypothetical protein